MPGWVTSAIYTIFLLIDGIIYQFVALAYRVFYAICKIDFFSLNNDIGEITNRIYVVLGVAMVFVFAYNIILMIANPDSLSNKDDKSFQGLAKNLIISLIMLTLLPTAFNYLYKLQNNIIDSNVIGAVILGGGAKGSNDPAIIGNQMALNIFDAFYHPVINNEDYDYDKCSTDESELCKEYVAAYDSISQYDNSSISDMTSDDILFNALLKKDSPKMKYYFLLSSIAGCIAFYLIISFSIDAGIRLAKLLFYQIISPLPVTLRIFKPKGGTFDRWLKGLTETYLSLFLRLIIIYFSVYVVQLVPDIITSVFQNITDTNIIVKLTARVIIILGILQFAKDGPKLIEDMFAMAHVETSIKKKLNDNTYAQKGAGMLATGGMGALNRAVNRYKTDRAHGGGKILSGVGAAFGAVGGLLGGARRGFRQDYSHGMRSGINSAYQDTAAAGAHNDDIRGRGAEEGGVLLSGLTGGIMNATDNIRGRIQNAGEYITGGAQLDEQINQQSTLKNAMTSFMDSNGKRGTDYNTAIKTRDDIYEKLRRGEIDIREAANRAAASGVKTKFQYDGTGKMTKITIDGKEYTDPTSAASGLRSALDNKSLIAQAEQLNGLGKDIIKTRVNQISEQINSMGSSINLNASERTELSTAMNALINSDGVADQKFVENYNTVSKWIDTSIRRNQAQQQIKQEEKNNDK